MKRKILLHICCGVCASKTIERLQSEFDIIGYFYNPNIEPPLEYQKRLEATKVITNYFKIPLIIGLYNNELWHQAILGLEHWQEGGRRCWRCYQFRLENTAEQAQTQLINYFATTLTASPHKNAKDINGLGRKIASQFGLNFINSELRPSDRTKPSLARKLGIYHQNYCGCIYSVPI
ncbi:MAG: epoxyqueuosine reductase QueH [candidate division WOR-3 bacterium]|nr:epoxyqueuosine reductase QueH [candidate division WOR-3 bacterium]